MNGKKMTSGSSTKASKYGISRMGLNEVLIFATPTDHEKRLIRRAAHNQNERSDRRYMTRLRVDPKHGDFIHVTRVR